MKLNKIILVVIVGLSILLLTGCPEKSTEPDPDGTSWNIGAISNYNVSGGSGYEFEESITGGTFIFPDGADGVLEVAHITSGPTPPLSGAMFWIKYDGDEPVQLSMPMADNDFLYLHGFGSSNGAFDGGIDADQRWHSLPIIDTSDGNIVFHLAMPFTAGRFRPARSNHRGFNHYQIAAIPAGSSRADTIVAAHAQARDFINIILDSLPPSIQDAARNEVHGSIIFSDLWAGRLAPSIYSDANYYKGFFNWSIFAASAMPMIGIYPFTSGGFAEDVISHEVGHYMNHVLVGDATYLTLENQAPSEIHGLGDVHAGRSVIVEDYAFFTEYFLTGTIGSDVDPTTHIFVLSRDGTPISIDFPSVEGFAAFLLANLNRTSPVIPRIGESGVDSIPLAGASFRDIWGIVARGATNINQLRTHIHEYLTGVGKADMLPVIAQRVGWRYRCRGRVVTDDGTGNNIPLENATVVQIAKVGSREYRNPIWVTLSDGQFTIFDAFPGNSTIRIYHGTDSTDFPLNIDWNKPTNEEIVLGDYPVATSLFDLLHTMNQVKVLFTGRVITSYGSSNSIDIASFFIWDPPYGTDIDYLPLVWSGNSLSVNGIITNGSAELIVDIAINFSASGRDVLTVSTDRTAHESGFTNYRQLVLHDLPLISSSSIAVSYGLSGNVQANVDDIDIWSTYTGSTFSHVDWSSPSSITIEFKR